MENPTLASNLIKEKTKLTATPENLGTNYFCECMQICSKKFGNVDLAKIFYTSSKPGTKA